MFDVSRWAKAKPIGYLSRGEDYPLGDVSEEILGRLVKFVQHPLGAWCGYHDCDLDPCDPDQAPLELQYHGFVIPSWCSTDIFVPDKTVLYVAPSLILHYIRLHHYLPPACFLNAVMDSPEPGSQEYLDAVNRAEPPVIG